MSTDTLATVTVVPADVVTSGLTPGAPPPGISFENGASVTDRVVHAGDDGVPTTVLWNSTVGTIVYAEPLAHPERGYVVSGEGRFVDADGSEHPVTTGSAFILPAGWTGRFEVDTVVRKVIFV